MFHCNTRIAERIEWWWWTGPAEQTRRRILHQRCYAAEPC